MANDLNQCNFIGRLGKDVETRFTPSGKEVCTFTMACGRKYNGNDDTTWISVVAWDKLANICAKYLKKGSLIYISGRMAVRNYDDRDGVKKYVTEIIANQMQMLDTRDAVQHLHHGQDGTPSAQAGQSQSQAHGGQPQQGQGQQGANSGGGGYSEPSFDPSDEIPFACMPEFKILK